QPTYAFARMDSAGGGKQLRAKAKRGSCGEKAWRREPRRNCLSLKEKARCKLDVNRLAVRLRADPEINGKRRQQLFHCVGLRQKSRVLDKTRFHSVGHTAFGRIEHFEV